MVEKSFKKIRKSVEKICFSVKQSANQPINYFQTSVLLTNLVVVIYSYYESLSVLKNKRIRLGRGVPGHLLRGQKFRICMSTAISLCSLSLMKLVYSTHSLIIQSGKTFNQSKFVLINIRSIINF